MKRRFIAIFLVGGLGLGLCGCGNSSNSSAASISPAVEDTNLPGDSESAQEISDELDTEWGVGEGALPDYFRDSEPKETASAEDPESIEPEVTESEVESGVGSSSTDIGTSSLLTTHVIEGEDQDGYTIRETCQLSPIFTESDAETMYALWEALGEDVAYFPSEESLYGTSHPMRDMRDNFSCDKLEYLIGTYMIENLTDGFPITPDNPRKYSAVLWAESSDSAATILTRRSVTAAVHSDSATYYENDDGIIMICESKMYSNVWGPVTFIVAFPNGSTPNQPGGYRYDEATISFRGNVYSQRLDTNVYSPELDTFAISYFTKGVD